MDTNTGKRPVGRRPSAAVGWSNGKWVFAQEPEPSDNFFIEDVYDFNADHPDGIGAAHDKLNDKLRQVKDEVDKLNEELKEECAPAPLPLFCFVNIDDIVMTLL